MSDFTHLSRAPIVEALIFFQADASALWKPETVAPEFARIWPDHAEAQEMQSVKMEVRMAQGKAPKQEVALPITEGLIFRSKSKSTIYQARRDGFIASWLSPYPDWETFAQDAVLQWTRYSEVLGSPALHSVIVKFINRLEVPLGDFKPERYFTTHPAVPPNLGWKFANFVQQLEYVVPSTSYGVRTVLARAFDATPDMLAFILDIEVKLREPLAASDCPLNSVLEEMRKLKNQAFFGLLTEPAWREYI